MLESKLIDYCYTQPWADKIITTCDVPPAWLSDISVQKHSEDQLKTLRDYAFSEPFEKPPNDIEKFHVGCLWLRYNRREISWATLLSEIGDYLDAANGDWDCETPYHYLNIYENSYFTEDSEENTKKEYLNEQNVIPWTNKAQSMYDVFKSTKRANKHLNIDAAKRRGAS